jgi:hypothetical protein
MKCETGFMLAYDKDLKRMLPFFMKVRSSDIVKNTNVDIYSALTYTSGRWDLARQENGVDSVMYEFTADWDSDVDPNGGVVGSTKCKGSLSYYMYMDGRYEIHGYVRMNPVESTAISGNTDHHVYSVYLPFAFKEYHPMLRVGWAYGNTYELAIASQVDEAPITDLIINPSEDKTKYPFLLKLNVFDTGAGASALDELRKLADPDYNDLSVHDYIMNAFPVTIDYRGYWRSHALDVEEPQYYNEGYSGDYITTPEETNLLTKPSLILGEIIETLPKETAVRCNGYYSTTGSTTWLYVVHTATNTTGYLPVGEVEVS